MTEQKWYSFSSFMNECIYHADHPDCPYRQFRDLDQYQRLEKIMCISDRQAQSIMNNCRQIRIECKPVLIINQKINRVSVIS